MEAVTVPGAAVFDTDVLIDYARGVATAVAALDAARREAQPMASVVTYLELLAGCRDKRELSILDAFMATLRLVHIDVVISRCTQDLMRAYRLSHGLRLPDALIAATALTNGWALISKNQKDYRFIPGLRLPPYPTQ